MSVTDTLHKAELSLVRRLVRSALFWAIPFLLVAAAIMLWLYRSSTLALFDDPQDATATSLVAAVEVDQETKLLS